MILRAKRDLDSRDDSPLYSAHHNEGEGDAIHCARPCNRSCDCSPGGKVPSAEYEQFMPLPFEKETALAVLWNS